MACPYPKLKRYGSIYLLRMKQLVAVVFILGSYHSQAQNAQQISRESFFYSVYSNYLHELRSPDLLARHMHATQVLDKLPGNSMPSSYFSSGRYSLLYFHTFG